MSTASVIRMPESSDNMDISARYRKAYRVAEGNISFGEFAKASGVLAGALMLLVTIAFSERSPEELLVGVFLAVAAGFALYALGAILCVQAYTLRATLDSAANSSSLAGAAFAGGSKARIMPLTRTTEQRRSETTP